MNDRWTTPFAGCAAAALTVVVGVGVGVSIGMVTKEARAQHVQSSGHIVDMPPLHPDPSASITFCGTNCNCGEAFESEFVQRDGSKVKGYTAPSGYDCTCASVAPCPPGIVPKRHESTIFGGCNLQTIPVGTVLSAGRK